jgi:thiol-disulfide isomerase/thioredoxin
MSTSTSTLPIITSVASTADFHTILQNNPGIVILKMGAEWCGPCKRIQREVEQGFAAMPANVQKVVLDIDESIELYSYLKKKRRVNGIPAILSWNCGNDTDVPDDGVLGGDSAQVIAFFQRVITTAKGL